MTSLNDLSWIDLTSLAVLVLFAVWGIFRGALWQASRLISLFVGYFLASLYAQDVASWLEKELAIAHGQVAVYVAYFTIFIAVLIALSLLTMVLDHFVRKLQLGFYNRLGGAVLGVGTGLALLIAVLGLFYAIAPAGSLVKEARASTMARVSRFVVESFPFPADIAELYKKDVVSLRAPAESDEAGPGEKAPGKAAPDDAPPGKAAPGK